MKDKVLVSFSSYNSPVFLEHLLESIERFDAGYPFKLLILDNSSTDPKHLKVLEKYSKKYKVETKPNHGRAQGGYHYAYRNNLDYAYYFFLHDDSVILRDNWLKVAVDRMKDTSMEDILRLSSHTVHFYPVGKVGFQGYEWGYFGSYMRTGYKQIFHYMKPICEMLQIQLPYMYQHLNDDRLLYSNECLSAIYDNSERIYNIEHWKQLEENGALWKVIHQWFKDNGLHNNDPFPPNERYGPNYHTFQTVSEFLNDINPMRFGFRTHCVLGDGYCQEELGWSKFWGNEYIAHYGDHVVFKRLSGLLNTPEEVVRQRFKEKTFLTICDKIIKNETKYVER